MNWKHLFHTHIWERGYDYYCENAVENLNIFADIVSADVIGTEDYEVEISLEDGEITELYCSCPYADSGRNCKHMAAVLYEWTKGQSGNEEIEGKDNPEDDLFIKAHTVNAYRKKTEAIQRFVENADMSVVRSYLTSILAENEKLLLRFHSIVKEQLTEEDVERYIAQVDDVAENYLGSSHYISYYDADAFVSELQDVLVEGACCMIAHGQYLSAFKLINYIFLLISDVGMDDSDGGLAILAERTY